MSRFILTAALIFGLSSAAGAVPTYVPDNGSGTAHMPIRADYYSQNQMNILDGLGGDSILIDAVLNAPTVTDEVPGGSLAGTKSGGGGVPLFTWTMQGTGAFSAYNRVLSFPVAGPGGGVLSFPSNEFEPTDPFGASIEVHAAPRVLNAPVQAFPINLHRGFSQIANIGDVDFDLLRVVMGTDFGMPSPGYTILTRADDVSGPRWAVDSCIEMTYRIDFVGRPGGPLAGRSGSTNGIALMQAGEGGGPCLIPEPSSISLAAMAVVLMPIIARRRRA